MMTNPIPLVFVFTLIIHAISTLAYAVRWVGVKTGRLAVSFAIFNILVLVSRTSNSIQAPLLAKKIERDLSSGLLNDATGQFRWLLLAASVGTLIGALLIPTFQRIFSRLVVQLDIDRSIPRLLIHGFSKIGVRHFKHPIKLPSKQNILYLKDVQRLPIRLILLNTAVVSLLTVGVFASLYAAYLNPSLRTTASNLASIVTGIATIFLVVFIDPYFSLLTDDVLGGKRSVEYFNKCVISMVISRLAGTLAAQLLFIPCARMIAWVAGIL